jgi:hypothetical protein
MALNAEVSFTWLVPMHFGTFPPLVCRPSALQELVGSGVEVLDIKPGDMV